MTGFASLRRSSPPWRRPKAPSAILDGGAVVLDKEVKSGFQALRRNLGIGLAPVLRL